MTSTPNTGYLIEDQWDDWFQYSTMYDLYIVDSLSHQCYMGKTKIGQKGMVEDQRRPALPESFPVCQKISFLLVKTATIMKISKIWAM